jgi:hypothetical protein
LDCLIFLGNRLAFVAIKYRKIMVVGQVASMLGRLAHPKRLFLARWRMCKVGEKTASPITTRCKWVACTNEAAC